MVKKGYESPATFDISLWCRASDSSRVMAEAKDLFIPQSALWLRVIASTEGSSLGLVTFDGFGPLIQAELELELGVEGYLQQAAKS